MKIYFFMTFAVFLWQASLFSNPIQPTKPGVIAANLALPKLPEHVQTVVDDYFNSDNDARKYVLKKGTKPYEDILNTGGSPIYGEILPRSVQKLLKELEIKKSDVVYDMGSGRGEFSILVAMLSPASKSVGIELAEQRFEISQNTLCQLEKSGIIKNGRVKFIKGDFYLQNIGDATIVYACSTCFAEIGIAKLAKKVAKLPKIRYFVTLKKLSSPKKIGFKKLKEIVVPTTWSAKSIAYVYVPHLRK